MIKNYDFIVFSDDWGRHPFSCMHIMKRFLPENRILWVNTIGMRRPKLSWYDLKRSIEKVGSWFGGSTSREGLPTNLTVVSPMMLPYNDIPLVRKFNRKNVIRKVRNEMRRLNFRKPVLVTTIPGTSDYIGVFGEILDIYYCVDDFTEWPGVNKSLIALMEEKLLNDCDLVFASAEQLCLKKERNGKRPILLPHGVDFEHFNSGPREIGKPQSLKTVPNPIIGFFGAVSPWLDFDLITELASARPLWSFVFMGPIDAGIGKLRKFGNVYFLGSIPYKDVPTYASSFDVAIIPFLVNNLTVSVNPLKLLEYFACGLPVVCSDLPEVRKYSNVVYIPKNKNAFLESIEKALSENSEDGKKERLRVARNHSWDKVAEEFSAHIERWLANN